MRANLTKKGVSIFDIYNESMMERVEEMVRISATTATYSDHGTKCKITGNKKQVNAFIDLWNE